MGRLKILSCFFICLCSASVISIACGRGEDKNADTHLSIDGVQQERPSPLEKIAFLSGSGGLQYKMFVVDADGSNRKLVGENVNTDLGLQVKNSEIQWSPDGSRIAFSSGPLNDQQILVADVAGSIGGQSLTLANCGIGCNPRWSPDGSGVVFTSWVKDSIYVAVAPYSGGAIRLASGASAEWSPDGSQIAFIGLGDLHGLMVMNHDGSGLRKLAEEATDIAWSPDGRYIAFRRGVFGIEIVSVDQPGAGALARLPAEATSWLAWSPKGDRIAYMTWNNHELYVLSLDGSERTLISTIGDWLAHPVWSPDGNRIAFVSGGNLYVADADGPGKTKLAVTYEDCAPLQGCVSYSPSWSPDGRFLAFVAEGGGISLFDTQTGDEWKVTTGEGDVWPTWQPARNDSFPSANATPDVVGSQAPVVSVSLAGDRAGKTMYVVGSLFQPNESVSIRMTDSELATRDADVNGTFRATVIIPTTRALTSSIIQVIGSESGMALSLPIDEIPEATPTPTPEPAPSVIATFPGKPRPGSTAVVDGLEFKPGQLLILTLDDVPIGQATPDSAGAFTVSLALPQDLRSGSHELKVSDEAGAQAISLTFDSEE